MLFLRSAIVVATLFVQSSVGIWPFSGKEITGTQHVFREGCTVSHYTAYETYNKPIDFRAEPLDPFNGPKLNPPNKSMWPVVE